jgi:hypothetical protein
MYSMYLFFYSRQLPINRKGKKNFVFLLLSLGKKMKIPSFKAASLFGPDKNVLLFLISNIGGNSITMFITVKSLVYTVGTVD